MRDGGRGGEEEGLGEHVYVPSSLPAGAKMAALAGISFVISSRGPKESSLSSLLSLASSTRLSRLCHHLHQELSTSGNLRVTEGGGGGVTAY